MVARASRSGIGVGRLPRLLRGAGVLAMPDVSLDTTRHIESACQIAPGAGVLRLLVPGVAVEAFIDRRCVADRVEVTR